LSITRISGMATGMDTDSIVKKLMDVEKMSLNRLKQNQHRQIWLIDSYRQWNSDLFAFRSSTLFDMKLPGTYNTYDVGASQTNSISGTATSSAIAGTYSVTVNQLAGSANFTSNKIQLDTTKNFETQGELTTGTTGTISIEVVNSSTDAKAIQSANITIKSTDTINDVVNTINSATDKTTGKSLGLQAIYDTNLKQFLIKTKATGETTKIDFSKTTDLIGLDFLNNTLGIGIAGDATSLVTKGQNADIIFNGQQLTNLSTNDVTLMGINFTLKGKTMDENGNPVASTITVSQNIDTAIKNIKDFVDKYNNLIDKLNKVTSEAVYRDYLPLTDEQKNEMSEKEVELWETKAKSGLLRNDSLMKDLLYKLRTEMGSIVDNGSAYNSLASLGISSKNYQDRGKLYVDEKKLREAFQNDPESVKKVLTQTGDSSKNTNGLINRLYDTVSEGIKNLTSRAGVTGSSQYDQSVVGKLLSRIQTDISRQNDKLAKKENLYYKQFAAMEAAVAKFNSQSTWIYSQLYGGQ
jgi:flagellar hook-associated protein 2